QDVMISEIDCGTILGIETGPIKEGEKIIEPLSDRILGRVAVDDVYDPISGELLVEAAQLITEEIAEMIDNSAIETVKIRSVLTCESERGICANCYGRNLATGRMVDIGEAVGVMGAQSIGEPGTQLTLRTFHIGGTAGRIAAQSEVVARFAGKVQFEELRTIETVVEEDDESVKREICIGRNGKLMVIDDKNRPLLTFSVPYGAALKVAQGEMIERGTVLFEWDPYSSVILTDKAGVIRYVDLVENVTSRDELDETTLQKQRVVIESKNKNLSPHLSLEPKDGSERSNYILPVKALILVEDGETVQAGRILAKIPREIGKTKDITGGLPRVAELFEARKPKEQAEVSEIDGVVKFGTIKRGVREIIVEGSMEQKRYMVAYSKHVLVHDGDYVRAGEMLTDGAISPQDILKILGPNKVQEYLVNEIQEVYRLQGVRINDKHIETIVRQMMQKVKVLDPGDTRFL
nr:DNA-directed RNA polymerase subunit beta' [Calditrichia bacterium]